MSRAPPRAPPLRKFKPRHRSPKQSIIMTRCKIAGINFDHFHMGDLLRMVHEHPGAELVGISDEQPERMVDAQRNFSLGENQLFTDYRECLEKTQPDLVILCPASARHAEWTEKVAPFGTHILMEKPFASSLAEADRMIAAMAAAPGDGQLAINWPLRWVASHVEAHRQLQTGIIGDVREVRHYGGNRGPLWHGADKIENEPTAEQKAASWFYKRAEGGGSLQDYLGYGTTLGTWFLNGAKPIEVTAMWDAAPGLEVDEHCLAIARYSTGLSKFESRWGTFSDPWTDQPQPKCGFEIVGSEGTLASYDYESTIRLQTRERPQGFIVDAPQLSSPQRNPIEYFLACLTSGQPVEGPLSVETSRIGQQVVDTALRSAQEKRTLPLIGEN